MDITIVVPFWNGHARLPHLLASLPDWLSVVVVDDQSDEPLQLDRPNTQTIRLDERGYFAGAVNAGIEACDTDVLVLNQDAQLHGTQWLDLLAEKRERYAIVGERAGKHPAWPEGYVQGTFMYLRRDAWREVGELNDRDYPLWGCTCEWQLRACRRGYEALLLRPVPGLEHGADSRESVRFLAPDGKKRRRKFGESIAEALRREPERGPLFTDTPPLVTVVVPCYNYGHYLSDAINSLVGGPTCLGQMDGQSLQSFEVVIVDDASTDDSWDVIQDTVDPWRGIRAIRHPQNRGTPVTLNTGVEAGYGRYVTILSADDMREPWSLERGVRACQANPHSVAYGNLRVLRNGERGKLLKMYPYDFERLLHKNMLPASITYPKAAWREVGGYPAVMRDGREDWAFGVALGIHGWCGVHVGDNGSLVRREGHNRSLRTAKAGMVPQFKRQLMALYPKIYGGERPMRCCGGGRRRATTESAPPPRRGAAPRNARVGAEGMVALEYIGGNAGTTKWIGAVTRTTYAFGNSPGQRVKYVDKRDVPDLLQRSENRHQLFRRYMPPPEPVAMTPPPVQIQLTGLRGIGPATAAKLTRAGFDTVANLANADPDEVALLASISQGQARRFVQEARDAIG